MFLLFFILSEFNRSTSFIDAPTAYTQTPNILTITFDGSIAIPGGEFENHKVDFDYLNLRYSFIQGFEVALTSYTLKNYSLHAKYSFFRIEPTKTYFSIGIDDITYTKNVSPVGDRTDSTGMWDDDYSYNRKPAELGSVYLVFSSSLLNMGYGTLGIGRGRFIGYGPRSDLFHIELPDTLGNFDFGIFFSYYYKYNNLETGIEFDGRDFNLGVVYHLPVFPVDIGISLVKLEHFFDTPRQWNPRFAFGITYNQKIEMKKYNNYTFLLRDKKGEPVTAYLTITDELGNTIVSENVSGEKKLKTEFKGNVMINVKSDKFEEYNEKIELQGPQMEKVITLEPYIAEGQLVIKIFDLQEPSKTLTGIVTIKDKDGNVVVQEDVSGERSFVLKQGEYNVEVKPRNKNIYDWFGKTKIVRKELTKLDVGLVKKEFKLVLTNIEFDLGKATIKPEYYKNIDEMANSIKLAIESNPVLLIEIQGHTDSQGSDSYNLKLSQARAESVKEYLVKNHGIDPQRLIARGYGETKPVAPNTTKEGRAKNRRVEFVILQK